MTQRLENLDDIIVMSQRSTKGETPSDVKQMCLSLCQQFLAGNWIKLTVDDIEVNRIIGGLTNQLMHCKVINGNDKSDEPQEVVVRFNGQKYDVFKTFDTNTPRFYDGIITSLMSENKIGPKVYGIGEIGQILHFYKNRLFSKDDIHNNGLTEQLAKNLVRFHGTNSPMPRNRNWILNAFMDFQQKVDQKFIKTKSVLFEKYNCNALMNSNLKEDIEMIVKIIQTIDSKLVFCHNDFRFANILVTESDGIVLCDFDYTCYGYRGYDLAQYFTDCAFTSNEALEEYMNIFIGQYVKQSEQLFGKEYSENAINSVKHIVNETKQGLQIFSLLVTIFCLISIDGTNGLPFDEQTLVVSSNLVYTQHLMIRKMIISIEI